jgi:class 3 adenylate cyclase/CheY-like chemotaxis protein
MLLPGKTLSKLRQKIRAPLYQIISYAEIMAEEMGRQKISFIPASIAEIISSCVAVLQITSNLPPVVSDIEEFVAHLRQELIQHCRKILASADGLQQLVLQRDFVSFRSEAVKLYAAARNFETTVDELSSPAELALLHPDAAPLSAYLREDQRANHENGAQPAAQHTGLILVVDDNEGNRDVLSRRLLRDGYEVMLAETGRQALHMVMRYHFDIILLDIMMPEMDGIAVLSELKKSPELRHLPVVMISAVDEEESVVRCIQLGADDYLLKPFNPILLRARINSLLERKRLRDEEMRKAVELARAFEKIEIQSKKMEQLLLNILPRTIAEELQCEGSVQPMYFEDVTVAFADIVGFTRATEQLPADELVNVLHRYFTAFDNIMVRYGLEKLKTIGDCYMFAGGCPVRSPSHPVDTILAALEMIHITRAMAGQGPVDWQLRIGVNTGPVIAGVVGIHKFTFDIWGDAVNFSSRMESSGEAARVNLSANTYTRVKDFFACEKRGMVKIKDGREVEMYFVKGIATGLLANKSVSSVQAFRQRYRAYFRQDPPAFPDFLAEMAG